MKLSKLTTILLSLGLATGVYASDLKSQADRLSYTLGTEAGIQLKKEKVAINPVLFRQGIEVANGMYVSLDLKTSTDQLSYMKGYEVGTQYKKQDTKLNSAVFQEGLTTGLSGTAPALKAEQQALALKNFEKARTRAYQSEFKSQSADNKSKGAAFLDKNVHEVGVNVTQSGLQYKLIEPGKGARPTAADTVTVEYQCTFLNKKACGEASQGNESVTLSMDNLIPGLSEALQLMQTGSKYVFYIPSKLAYGEKGAPDNIGPNQTLIFTIKLVSIK